MANKSKGCKCGCKPPLPDNVWYKLNCNDLKFTSADHSVTILNTASCIYDLSVPVVSSYTFNNALTNTSGIVQLGSTTPSGSPLLHDTYINLTDQYSLITNSTDGINRTRFDQNITNISLNADKEDFSLRNNVIASVNNIQLYQQDNSGGTAGRRILLDRSTGIFAGEYDSGTSSYRGLIVKYGTLGQIQFNSYGSGSFTGVPTYSLQVDSGGNIIEKLATLTPDISAGSSVPASTPNKIGDVYIDTNNKKIYFATGTSSSADWTITN
jgi:hypothetical protein